MPVRYTIKHMQQFAREYDGKCLSKEYHNDETRLKWMCSNGHTWDASYTIIRQGGWCMQCAKEGSSSEKLEELQQIAKMKGGRCLSQEYINIHTKLKWKCKENHQWEAESNAIKNRNTWCPYCSGNAPRTIKDMQSKAKEKNGKCLSGKYLNSQTKLWWECEKKHKWQAQPNSIFSGRWCRICARIEQSKQQRNDISIYHSYAEKKGGRLLTQKYISSHTPMEWICSENHVWRAGGGQILSGSWCPFCAGKARRTIKDMQQAAKLRGGLCLSKIYYNNHTKLLWQCAKKHRWESIPSNVINNSTWCGVCAMDIKKYNLPQYKNIKKPTLKQKAFRNNSETGIKK